MYGISFNVRVIPRKGGGGGSFKSNGARNWEGMFTSLSHCWGFILDHPFPTV